MLSISVSIDVPDMQRGIAFYTAAFGFEKVAEPVPGVVVMKLGAAELCLLEKAEGSSPAPGSADVRRYGRHWTPVHLDIHVDDFHAALAQALAAGATQEMKFDDGHGHPAAAFCSDPFGHGFCILGRRNISQ